MTLFSAARFTVCSKQALELIEMVGLRSEVAEMFPRCLGAKDFLLHLVPVKSMKTVSLDDAWLYVFAMKNMFEGHLHSRGTCAGGASHGNYRVLL
jgi:hypothetical protein